MKYATTILVVTFAAALVSSLPVPDDRTLRSQVLERLVMVEGDNAAALRSKRTIGILRQLFPGLTQIVERKVNAITSEVIMLLGPIVLRSVLGGGGGGAVRAGGENGARTSNAGTTVQVASPFDNDENEEGARGNSGGSVSNGRNELSAKSKSGSRVSISLPTYPPDEEDLDESTKSLPLAATTIASSSSSTSVSNNLSLEADREAEDRASEDVAESQNNEVRVQFADDQTSASANEAVESELAPLEDIQVSDDENRNKRFLNFGFGASGGAGASAGSGGGTGGSGNFLFDIIRQAADGAARAAGTVYRVVAGTQSLGLGLSASRDVAPAPQAPAAPAPNGPDAGGAPAAAPPTGTATQPPPLVAGSGSSQQGDIAADAPSPGRNDGATEAVPGPVTRLFVVANRGISNLIQDLILRLAATSERIVNFKARLITSII